MIWFAVIILLLLPLAAGWGIWLIFAVAAWPAKRAAKSATARGAPAESRGNGKIDVLIPAHDEELVLPALLESLCKQNAAGRLRLGRVLMVADHCADQTADIARRFGSERDSAGGFLVEVLERGSGPRGKPAALRDGLAMLAQRNDAGELVLLLDADCEVSENLLEAMAGAMDAGHAVAQAAYVMEPADGGGGHSLGTIAFALKTMVRPRGMGRLGIPVQLFGTGMCFRAELLRGAGGCESAVKFSDHLTEDLAISHDLLLQGIGAVYVDGAVVRSRMPADRGAMATQKLRWETGQVQTWKKLPGMMGRLMARGDWRGMLALLDWSALPLAMGLAAWGAIAAMAVIVAGARLAPWWILLAPAGALALLAGYVLIGTMQVAGVGGVGRIVVAGPRFFLWKLGLYGRMLTGRGARGWVKTARALPPEVRP